MKNMIVCAVIAAAGGLAGADIYTDTVGEIWDPAGLAHVDIASVEVTNDADFLYISIQTQGDLDAAAWAKYGVGIADGTGTGDNSAGWTRNIDWGRNITHWIGSWADDNGTGVGGQVWAHDGGWSEVGAVVGDDSQHAAGVQAFAIALADLGLSIGDTIEFDVVVTGGFDGDGGWDHLSRADTSTTNNPGWGDRTTSGDFLSYTLIPAPGAAALLGMGGLVAARRRR